MCHEDTLVQNVSCFIEDGGFGPPLSAGSSRQQIAMALRRLRVYVVSGHGEGAARLRQIGYQETNESESCDEAS